MRDLNEILEKLKMMVLDGAMATELETMGCDLNDALWSAKVLAEAPELIRKVHLSYFEAGADCGTSASYQATIPGFLKKGYSVEQSEELIRRSMRQLISARDEWWKNGGENSGRIYPVVSGAVGPYGAYLADGSEYRGCYGINKEELKRFHFRRMELLLEAGSEIFAMETIPALEEAMALAELTEELDAQCFVSFSCKNGTDISEGTPIRDCARALNNFKCVKAVGINCTAPQFVKSLIEEVRKGTDKHVIVYPNSGEQYDPHTKTWHGDKSGKTYGQWAREWMESGADIIGGCCRTTPANIKEICAVVR